MTSAQFSYPTRIYRQRELLLSVNGEIHVKPKRDINDSVG